jgi:hypothetical protein
MGPACRGGTPLTHARKFAHVRGFRGSGLHLTVPGDTSLLETLLAAGVDVQYFGWCRLALCCDSAHRIPAVTCNDLPL